MTIWIHRCDGDVVINRAVIYPFVEVDIFLAVGAVVGLDKVKVKSVNLYWLNGDVVVIVEGKVRRALRRDIDI